LSGGEEDFGTPNLPATRYVRFNYSLERDSTSDQVFINGTNITLGGKFHFLIRDEECQAEEEELFTLSGLTNAHAGDPGQYPYRVCASHVERSDYTQTCTVTEAPVISFFGSGVPNTHLATEPRYFSYKLCTDS
ncbi:MAG: hypothetical protein SVS85_00115, partial [Candidatus Nanohaloarchaea archaeon]|nr:hypothetical protein [Candidatus Nanohaloarchaea archaeon]